MDVLTTMEKQMNDNKINEAKETLEKGKKLVSNRLKMIRLADREDWLTVQEYLADELASDSDDDKNISKAIKSANALREKRKKAKESQRKTYNYRKSRFVSSSRWQPRDQRDYTSRIPQRRSYDNKPCWGCGRVGHFQSNCPFNRPQVQPYPDRKADGRY